ncbi:hypothetical protein [Mesonia sp. HuA40]|uniref:hypothetical protein n=1 Tax=Mesonia sp. HuA40 TaxID=2602761 RepID=UPI0011CB120D|nr:hypothetical protein [Mesonia sp. HuA40]TXK74541.1 hypothetical protein FT993_01865 [Mesonia sp. HuA40]
MRYLIIFICLVSPNLFAQDSVISVNEASNYIGQEVIVQGKVDQVVHLTSVRGKPTYFNMGGNYPNQKLTLLLWDSNEHKFIKGTQFYEGKIIKVIGTIETYRGKPQIIIREPEQIEVLEGY